MNVSGLPWQLVLNCNRNFNLLHEFQFSFYSYFQTSFILTSIRHWWKENRSKVAFFIDFLSSSLFNYYYQLPLLKLLLVAFTKIIISYLRWNYYQLPSLELLFTIIICCPWCFWVTLISCLIYDINLNCIVKWIFFSLF